MGQAGLARGGLGDKFEGVLAGGALLLMAALALAVYLIFAKDAPSAPPPPVRAESASARSR